MFEWRPAVEHAWALCSGGDVPLHVAIRGYTPMDATLARVLRQASYQHHRLLGPVVLAWHRSAQLICAQ
eukprot:6647178-Lingulodinium_polyedra.AAC.1